MGVWDFLLMLVVAAICGAIGEAIAGYSMGGCAMSIVVGFIGAFLGRVIQSALNLPTWFTVSVGGSKFPIIWSVLGAAAFVLVLRLVLGRRSRI